MRSFIGDNTRTRGRRSRTSGLFGVLVLVWLICGAVAAGQRDYFDTAPTNCASTGTIIVTVLAGPLNYLGMNPTIGNCDVEIPQPST